MKKAKLPSLFDRTWTFPSHVTIGEHRLERSQIAENVARYEGWVSKRMRVAFQVFFDTKPLGVPSKNPRPVWVVGVYSSNPMFTISTGQHPELNACKEDLRLQLRRARTMLRATKGW